jgi:hypothetical protein
LSGFTQTNIPRLPLTAPSSWRGHRTQDFAKAKVKARSKTKNYFCKVFDQTFFKKFVGCGAKPHDLHTDAQSLD